MTGGGPAVTVVIPTHNRCQLVLRTLDSVLRQRDVDLEVVVVDDGGSDGTTRAVRGLGRDDVRLVRHECSKGVSAARNAGLAAARTAWVAFVDDDDLWAPDKVHAQLAALAENPEARWSCVGAVLVDGALREGQHSAPPPSGDVAGLMLQRQAIPAGGSGVLLDTQLARDIGGFDERIGIAADWDFYLRLSLRSPIAAVARPLVAYYVHTDSMYHNPGGLLAELLFMEEKYAGSPEGRSFAFDHARWFVRLTGMAHRLGDRDTARRLLRQGVRDAGVVSIGREMLRRIGLRVSRRRPQEFRFDEPIAWWLDRYAEWAL